MRPALQIPQSADGDEFSRRDFDRRWGGDSGGCFRGRGRRGDSHLEGDCHLRDGGASIKKGNDDDK